MHGFCGKKTNINSAHEGKVTARGLTTVNTCTSMISLRGKYVIKSFFPHKHTVYVNFTGMWTGGILLANYKALTIVKGRKLLEKIVRIRESLLAIVDEMSKFPRRFVGWQQQNCSTTLQQEQQARRSPGQITEQFV